MYITSLADPRYFSGSFSIGIFPYTNANAAVANITHNAMYTHFDSTTFFFFQIVNKYPPNTPMAYGPIRDQGG